MLFYFNCYSQIFVPNMFQIHSYILCFLKVEIGPTHKVGIYLVVNVFFSLMKWIITYPGYICLVLWIMQSSTCLPHCNPSPETQHGSRIFFFPTEKCCRGACKHNFALKAFFNSAWSSEAFLMFKFRDIFAGTPHRNHLLWYFS